MGQGGEGVLSARPLLSTVLIHHPSSFEFFDSKWNTIDYSSKEKFLLSAHKAKQDPQNVPRKLKGVKEQVDGMRGVT